MLRQFFFTQQIFIEGLIHVRYRLITVFWDPLMRSIVTKAITESVMSLFKVAVITTAGSAGAWAWPCPEVSENVSACRWLLDPRGTK